MTSLQLLLWRGLAPALAVVLSACAGKAPVPDWQMNAHGAAERATEAYLSGNTRVADQEWTRARAEVARTGRPELLARVELMRCAAQVASLQLQPCTAFEPLRADAAPPEQAYADYLAGRATAAQAALLPDDYAYDAAHEFLADVGTTIGTAGRVAAILGAAVVQLVVLVD